MRILNGTRRDLAELLSLSERRITELVTAKILPPRGSSGFDLVAGVRGYISFLKTEPNTLKAERLRLAKVKADILELQLQQRTGTLVLRSAVEKKVFELNRRARDSMLNIPARISGILASTSSQDEVFRLLTQEIVQAMERLAGGPGT